MHTTAQVPFYTPSPDFGESKARVLIGSTFATSVHHEGEEAHRKLTVMLPEGFQKDQTVVVLANDGEASEISGKLAYRQCPRG